MGLDTPGVGWDTVGLALNPMDNVILNGGGVEPNGWCQIQWDGATPNVDGAKPNEPDPKPTLDGAKPNEPDPKPTPDGTNPLVVTKPNWKGPNPTQRRVSPKPHPLGSDTGAAPRR